MEKLLVTGASGFVGAALCQTLRTQHVPFVACMRNSPSVAPLGLAVFETGDLSNGVDWAPALVGCSVVLHLAARVHMMREVATDCDALYRAINLDATMQLAEQAAQQGIRRFIYVSSVKVSGDRTLDRPFRAEDVPAPKDAYGRSKMSAELALQAWASRTGIELVIVRPPLVYGPGVRANFFSLMQLVRSGIPLPLNAVCNQRSLIALDNLVDFLILCINAPEAEGNTFLISDQHDLSTPELVRLIAEAMNKPARLVNVPVPLLAGMARLIGKGAAVERLLASLQVDSTPATRLLGWTPVVSVKQAIQCTVDHFLRTA